MEFLPHGYWSVQELRLPFFPLFLSSFLFVCLFGWFLPLFLFYLLANFLSFTSKCMYWVFNFCYHFLISKNSLCCLIVPYKLCVHACEWFYSFLLNAMPSLILRRILILVSFQVTFLWFWFFWFCLYISHLRLYLVIFVFCSYLRMGD